MVGSSVRGLVWSHNLSERIYRCFFVIPQLKDKKRFTYYCRHRSQPEIKVFAGENSRTSNMSYDQGTEVSDLLRCDQASRAPVRDTLMYEGHYGVLAAVNCIA